MISGASSSSSSATTTETVINSNSNSNSASVTSPSVEPSTYLSKNCILSTITTNHLHPHKRLRRSNNDDDDEYDSHDDEPGWNITNEMKARLQQSSWLRKELQDGGLRQLIDNIDAASDSMNDEEHVNQQSRERSHWNNQGRKKNMNSKNATRISARELALARTKHTHPKFASFTDQLLLLAGVLQPAAGGGGGGGGGEVTMSDTGLIDEGDNHGQLVLAPIPRLNRTVLKSSGSGTEEGEEVVDDDDGSNNSSSDEESEDSSSSSSSSSEEKGDGDESNDSTEE